MDYREDHLEKNLSAFGWLKPCLSWKERRIYKGRKKIYISSIRETQTKQRANIGISILSLCLEELSWLCEWLQQVMNNAWTRSGGRPNCLAGLERIQTAVLFWCACSYIAAQYPLGREAYQIRRVPMASLPSFGTGLENRWWYIFGHTRSPIVDAAHFLFLFHPSGSLPTWKALRVMLVFIFQSTLFFIFEVSLTWKSIKNLAIVQIAAVQWIMRFIALVHIRNSSAYFSGQTEPADDSKLPVFSSISPP